MKKIALTAALLTGGIVLPSAAYAIDGPHGNHAYSDVLACEKSDKASEEDKEKERKAKKKAAKALRSTAAYRIRTRPM